MSLVSALLSLVAERPTLDCLGVARAAFVPAWLVAGARGPGSGNRNCRRQRGILAHPRRGGDPSRAGRDRRPGCEPASDDRGVAAVVPKSGRNRWTRTPARPRQSRAASPSRRTSPETRSGTRERSPARPVPDLAGSSSGSSGRGAGPASAARGRPARSHRRRHGRAPARQVPRQTAGRDGPHLPSCARPGYAIPAPHCQPPPKSRPAPPRIAPPSGSGTGGKVWPPCSPSTHPRFQAPPLLPGTAAPGSAP